MRLWLYRQMLYWQGAWWFCLFDIMTILLLTGAVAGDALMYQKLLTL
jgi:hypothetical protein